MHKGLFVAGAALAACSANSPPQSNTVPSTGESAGSSDPTPIHGVSPGHKCAERGTEGFIGHKAGDEIGKAVLKASNAAVLRWAPPRTMLTMDYREDRVTIWLDAAKKITKIRCG